MYLIVAYSRVHAESNQILMLTVVVPIQIILLCLDKHIMRGWQIETNRHQSFELRKLVQGITFLGQFCPRRI